MRSTKKSSYFIIYLSAILVSLVAVYIRYLGRDVISVDFRNCLSSWYREVTTPGPGIDSLLAYTGDYPMPYAFLIWLLGKLPVPFIYSLKTFNVVFDFILAVLVGKITAYFKPDSPHSFWLGYCITLLLPNVIINGSMWGQCDGLYTTFLFAAFYCWLLKKYPAMMFLFGLAFSYKLQAVFFLPFVLIAYWLERKFSVFQFLIIPATMLAMNIPAVIAGYPISITFTKYIGQAGGYPWLYYFYPNLWFFFQARPYYLFSTGAVMLTVAALLIFVVLLVQKNVMLNRYTTLPILLWTAYTCAFFLPSMHERYGYFMELTAVILAIIYIRSAWIPALMILCTLPKYLNAIGLCGNQQWLQAAEAAGNTFVYFMFTCILWNWLFRGNINGDPRTPQKMPGQTVRRNRCLNGNKN